MLQRSYLWEHGGKVFSLGPGSQTRRHKEGNKKKRSKVRMWELYGLSFSLAPWRGETLSKTDYLIGRFESIRVGPQMGAY